MKSYIYGLLFKNKTLRTNRIKNKTIIKVIKEKEEMIKLKRRKWEIS